MARKEGRTRSRYDLSLNYICSTLFQPPPKYIVSRRSELELDGFCEVLESLFVHLWLHHPCGGKEELPFSSVAPNYLLNKQGG